MALSRAPSRSPAARRSPALREFVTGGRAAGTSTSSGPGTKRRAAKEVRRASNNVSRSLSKAIFGTPTRCWKQKTHWQYAHSSLRRPSSLSTNRFVFLMALRASCVWAVVIDHGSPAATRAYKVVCCVVWASAGGLSVSNAARRRGRGGGPGSNAPRACQGQQLGRSLLPLAPRTRVLCSLRVLPPLPRHPLRGVIVCVTVTNVCVEGR